MRLESAEQRPAEQRPASEREAAASRLTPAWRAALEALEREFAALKKAKAS